MHHAFSLKSCLEITTMSGCSIFAVFQPAFPEHAPEKDNVYITDLLFTNLFGMVVVCDITIYCCFSFGFLSFGTRKLKGLVSN